MTKGNEENRQDYRIHRMDGMGEMMGDALSHPVDPVNPVHFFL